MSSPRLDTSKFGPNFEDEDDEDDGLLSRFNTDSDYWQLLKKILRPTATFTTLFVYGTLAQMAVFLFAFLGYILHSVFLIPAMLLFTAMYPVGLLATFTVVVLKLRDR